MISILHVFSSFEVGGVQRRFADLIRLQIETGDSANFSHIIYALDGNYDALALLPAAAPVTKIDQAFDSPYQVSSLLALRALIKGQSVDLMVTYNWGSVTFALANRWWPVVPSIHVQDGFGPEEQSSQLPRRRWMRRVAYGGRTQVLVPSLTLQKIALDEWAVAAKNIHYIPNGMDQKKAVLTPSDKLRQSLGLDEKALVVGTVCAIRPEKNLGRLIEAFGILAPDSPAARLLIVGDGPALPEIKMLAERLGLKDKIVFAGYQTQPETYTALMDIMALSSDTEQMPMAVIEAMMAAKPVAATQVGDIHHMVSEANQPYIKGNSAAALADSLSSLLNSPDLRDLIGKDNREKAQAQFDDQQMAKEWFDLFRHTAKNKLRV